MSRIRGKNTKPEILLRKALWCRGLRYRLKSRLPGRPDIVFQGRRIAVFVDGCFWHGCPDHFQMPEVNRAFWEVKLQKTKVRDEEVNRMLKQKKWVVLRFWEHEIQADVAACAAKVMNAVRKNRKSNVV